MPHQQLRLTISPDVYSFIPLGGTANGNEAVKSDMAALTVCRKTGDLKLHVENSTATIAPECSTLTSNMAVKELLVYGIMGFIQLQAGDYMIVITNRELVGLLCGKAIYRASSFQILPIARNLEGLSEKQLDDEQTYVHLLEDHLKQNSFYYSYTYDLTLTVQRRAQLRKPHQSMWKNADERFFWNRFLAEKLISAAQDLSAFIIPVLQGYVTISPAIVNHRSIIFGLISRRSKERAGTRYFSRGLDLDGHASNFVETEQLLFCDQENSLAPVGHLQLSFVQTRGSMPGRWGQIPNTRYTPQLWTNDDLTSPKVLDTSKAHFERQIQLYGPQILVNLVNKKGYEQSVSELYASIIQELADPKLSYVHFDFHHECRKMRWHRVQLLVDQLEPELRKGAYCHFNAPDASCSHPDASHPLPHLQQRQTSVVRTNCMDCLDRTNVVQSTLARWMLNVQLSDLGVLDKTQRIENDEQFMRLFMTVWAENADILSLSYSGTGALKTDFTRTGKRTKMGALRDLSNSLIRYVKNNYLDGARQDGMDLFLGQFKVTRAQLNSPYESPLAREVPWTTRVMPMSLALAVVLFFVFLFSPEAAGIDSSTIYILLLSFLFAVSVYSWSYIQQNGDEFIDWPRLVPLEMHPFQQAPPSKWKHKRTNTGLLDGIEQGYELPLLKKTT